MYKSNMVPFQVKVGKTHKLTKEFEELLKRHPKVQYDKEGKKFSFASPYEWLNGPASILTELRNNRQMKIDNEALSFHKDVASWIDEYAEKSLASCPRCALLSYNWTITLFSCNFRLLEKRAVRGIRGTHTKRCKTYASSTGLYCDLYNPSDRCDACKALDGVVLYALGPDYLENVEMDVDIKQLWHNVSLVDELTVRMEGFAKDSIGLGDINHHAVLMIIRLYQPPLLLCLH